MRSPYAGMCLLSLVLIGLAGCDSGDGDGGGAGSFATEYAQVFCDKLSDCCASTPNPVDSGKCQSAYQRMAQSAPASAEFNQAKADECLSQLRAVQGCGTEIPACQQIYSGSKQPGEACEDDSDCATPEVGEAECGIDDTCVVNIRAAEGEDCVDTCTVTTSGGGTSTSCFGSGDKGDVVGQCYTSDGLTCDGDTKKCVKLKAKGEACSYDAPCVEGLFCDTTCVDFVAVGGDCTSSEACGPNGFCGDDQKCADRLHAGDACDGENDRCGYETHCSEAGKCETFGGIGDVCGLFADAF